MGLTLEDHPVGQHLQSVGRQGRPRGGDVDHQLGGAGGRRPLGRPPGLGDPVVGDAVTREEGPRLDEILGGHPHTPAGAHDQVVTHLLQVGHGLDVEPALGHGDHQVGATEAQRPQQQDAGVDVAAALAQ